MATIEDYLKAAQPSLDKVREHYKNRELNVSDVVDKDGHQYVNLVQEGGGVLGVALVGYTYVLEQMGIRFMKMAGTSAGAINTMVMACMGGKEEEKSVKVLELIAKKNLFDFVDGHPTAKRFIKNLITSHSFIRRIYFSIVLLLLALVASLLIFFYQLGRNESDFWFWFGIGFFSLTWGSSIFMFFRFRHLYRRFLKADYGINPGNEFLNWVSGVLEQNGIHNLIDLRRHIESVPEGGFRLKRDEDKEELKDLNKPRLENFLKIVTSDITNQMKVEFPYHWALYWNKQSDVKPGYFVRASMAVPIFFEPFVVDKIPQKDVSPVWEALIGLDDKNLVPQTARFVDGGMISNFPINVFYNPAVAVPRLPTFGIMLEDEVAPPRRAYKTFMSYAAAMFNTVRYNYDKEFLIKNVDFNRTIGRIDVAGINWLNFNLTEAEKVDLFKRGAEAAAAFLMGEVHKREQPAEGAQTAAQEAEQMQAPQAMEEDGLESAQLPRSTSKQQMAQEEEERGFDWNNYKQYRKTRKIRKGY